MAGTNLAGSQIIDEDDEFYTIRMPKGGQPAREPAAVDPRAQAQVEAAQQFEGQRQQAQQEGGYKGPYEQLGEQFQAGREAGISPQETARAASIPVPEPLVMPEMPLEGTVAAPVVPTPAPKGVPLPSREEKIDPLVEPDIAGETAESKQRLEGAQQEIEQAGASMVSGGVESNELKAAALEEQARGMEELNQKFDQEVEAARAKIYDDVNKAPTKEEERSLGSKLLMFLGVYLAGLGPGPNRALAMIENQIKRNYDQKLQNIKLGKASKNAAFKNAIDQAKMHHSRSLAILSKKAEAMAARSGNPVVVAKAKEFVAKSNAAIDKNITEVVNRGRTDQIKMFESKLKQGVTTQEFGKEVSRQSLRTQQDRNRFLPIPGTNKGYLGDNPEIIKGIKKALPSMTKIKSLVDTLQKFRKEHHSFLGMMASKIPITVRKKSAAIMVMAKRLVLTAKDVENLGVLQALDMDIINDSYSVNPLAALGAEDGKIQATQDMIKIGLESLLNSENIPYDERLIKLRRNKPKSQKR